MGFALFLGDGERNKIGRSGVLRPKIVTDDGF